MKGATVVESPVTTDFCTYFIVSSFGPLELEGIYTLDAKYTKPIVVLKPAFGFDGPPLRVNLNDMRYEEEDYAFNYEFEGSTLYIVPLRPWLPSQVEMVYYKALGFVVEDEVAGASLASYVLHEVAAQADVVGKIHRLKHIIPQLCEEFPDLFTSIDITQVPIATRAYWVCNCNKIISTKQLSCSVCGSIYDDFGTPIIDIIGAYINGGRTRCSTGDSTLR